MNKKVISVSTNDPETPKIDLEIQADLEVLFTAKPRRVWFGQISKTAPSVQTVQLAGTAIDTIKINNISLKEKEVTAFTWKVNDKRAQGEKEISLEISLDPSKMNPGRFDNVLIIETDHKDAQTLEVSLTGEVLGPITANPPRLYFGNFEPNQKMTKTVTLTSSDQIAFKIEKIEFNGQNFAADSYEKSAKSSHTINVIFTPNDIDNRIKSDMTITTDLKDHPTVIIPIHGYKKRDRKTTDNPNEAPPGDVSLKDQNIQGDVTLEKIDK